MNTWLITCRCVYKDHDSVQKTIERHWLSRRCRDCISPFDGVRHEAPWKWTRTNRYSMIWIASGLSGEVISP
jgi:hypothetical protein